VSDAYESFLSRRAQLRDEGGFTPTVIPDHLFDFQRDLLEFAVRKGRAALFADCGLGKTPIELAYAQNVHEQTGKPVLILTPLAVGYQMIGEAKKFGYEAHLSRDGSIQSPIVITNYEQLEKFNWFDFGGVVCDESSAIKSFEGATRARVTEFLRLHQYRLLATATAAPNDYIELGTSAEALGEMGHVDMLGRFFINSDRSVSSRGRTSGGGSVEWRLKGHAETPFWRWVVSWARAVRKPSDLGYEDGDFILPPLVEKTHCVEPTRVKDGSLFDLPAIGLQEEREETRRTLTERCEMAASILSDAETGVAWCHLNDEGRALTQMINGAVEVSGSDSDGSKEEKLTAFGRGEIRVLVTKPKIGAWGLNWQHSHTMTYFPSHSYEQMYQAIRRMWRFGQQNTVEVNLITTPGGEKVLANLKRKSDQADQMFRLLVAEMNNALSIRRTEFENEMEIPSWLK
jgi:hypothetical protein